jgi:hypothetical protein
VVVIREAAAGPAQHGNTQRLEVVHGRLAVAIDVRDLGVATYPQAPVCARTKVLREVAVQFRADDTDLGVGVDRYLLFLQYVRLRGAHDCGGHE